MASIIIPPPPASNASRTMWAAFLVLPAPDPSTQNWCPLSDESFVTGFGGHRRRDRVFPTPKGRVLMRIFRSLSCRTGQPFPISIIVSFRQKIDLPQFSPCFLVPLAPYKEVSKNEKHYEDTSNGNVHIVPVEQRQCGEVSKT